MTAEAAPGRQKEAHVDVQHRRINRTLRLGRRCHERGWPLGALLIDALNRILFSADIPSRMNLPFDVTFMHNGLGTVVDEHVVFEGPALVFQNVTLGYRMIRPGGLPTIGRYVVIGAGAVIVGDVHIGDGAFVAAGAVVATDVPAGHEVRSAGSDIRPLREPITKTIWELHD